jgi:hypothetical protein
MAGATLPALLANGLLVNTAEQLSTVDGIQMPHQGRLHLAAGRRRTLAAYPFFNPIPANFLLNFATWPPESIIRCWPVQAGCDFGSMSSRSVSPALP